MWWSKKQQYLQYRLMLCPEQLDALDNIEWIMPPPKKVPSNTRALIKKLVLLSYGPTFAKLSIEEKREQCCELLYGHFVHFRQWSQSQLEILLEGMHEKRPSLEIHHQQIFHQWIAYIEQLRNAINILPPQNELPYTEALRIRMMVLQEPKPKDAIQTCIENPDTPEHMLHAWIYAYGRSDLLAQFWQKMLTPPRLFAYVLLDGKIIQSISKYGAGPQAKNVEKLKRTHQDFMHGKMYPSEEIIQHIQNMPQTWHPNTGLLGNTAEQWHVTKIRLTYFPPNAALATWYFAWLKEKTAEIDMHAFPIQHSLAPTTKTVHLHDFEYSNMRIRVYTYLLLRSPDAWYQEHATQIWDQLAHDATALDSLFTQRLASDDVEKYAQVWLERQRFDVRSTAATLRAAYQEWSSKSSSAYGTRTLSTTLVKKDLVEPVRILYRAAENIIKYANPAWKTPWQTFETLMASTNAAPSRELWDAMTRTMEIPADQTPLDWES